MKKSKYESVMLTKDEMRFLERILDERLQAVEQDEQDKWINLYLRELFYNKSL
jgi:hypothetical protein